MSAAQQDGLTIGVPVSCLVERRALYDAGHSDTEIARLTGVKRNTITVWRRAAGLPYVGPTPTIRLSPERAAARHLLYQLGWGDGHIAREEGVAKCSVREWRHRYGLPVNFPSSVNERYTPRPTLRDLLKRVRRAIGYGLARDVAEDAASDLYLAVMSGAIPLDQIETAARKFGNRALDQFASRWGAMSLDKAIGDDSDFALIDTIRDDRASSWLEEMGATAW